MKPTPQKISTMLEFLRGRLMSQSRVIRRRITAPTMRYELRKFMALS
jgi:hypothetical protein